MPKLPPKPPVSHSLDNRVDLGEASQSRSITEQSTDPSPAPIPRASAFAELPESKQHSIPPKVPAIIILAYLLVVLIWSATPLSVVLSMHELGAIWAFAIRTTIAAILASVMVVLRKERLPWDRDALKRYGIGSLGIFFAMVFTYEGARTLASGMISVLYGLSPLMVGLMLLLRDGKLLKWSQWLGMLLGILGLILVFLPKAGATIATEGLVLVLCGVFTYSLSAVGMQQLPKRFSPLVQTTGTLWLSVLGCVVILPFLGGSVPTQWPDSTSWLALGFSAVCGSIVAMLCYFFLLTRIEASSMALATLITPPLALMLGATINHEQFSPHVLLGCGVILGGLLSYYAGDVRRLLFK